MEFTETKEIDRIEVVGNGMVQVRQVIRIFKGGVEVAKSYHRWTLSPAQDVSDQEPRVQAICNATWTPEVIEAYQAQLEANRLGV